MAITASVKKTGSESTPSLIRRFSKRVQGSGVVRRAKSIRYHTRTLSKTKKRASALRRIERVEEREEKEKLGLIVPQVRGRRR
ncbi:MAG: hypothetical protein AAB439_02670 [Patescibacteria group bacterium]